MKTWICALSLVLSTAVYAKIADTLKDEQPEFDTLALIFTQSSPHALITVAAKPQASGVLAEYVHLHDTRLEDPQQVWIATSRPQ